MANVNIKQVSGGQKTAYSATDAIELDDGSTSTWMLASDFNSGWKPASGTWTYASASTITIPTDGTTVYQASVKIRLKQGGGYKYYVGKTIAATLVTVFVNTDYTVANAAITDVAYSYEETPYGWPEWFNYATSPANITLGNGTIVAKYKVTGKAIDNTILFTLGSTSAVSGLVSFNAPVAETSYSLPICWLEDAGTNTFAGLAALSAGVYYIYAINTYGTYISVSATSSTVPYTWAVGDFIAINTRYSW